MSGIEVAGLVLGALPIIIVLLQGADANVILPSRKRGYVRNLVNALLRQKGTIEEIFLSLLKNSGCDYENALKSGLSDNLFEYLCDDDIKLQIMDFIGEGHLTGLIGTFQESTEILKAMSKKLARLVPCYKKERRMRTKIEIQGAPDDLMGIIRANQAHAWEPADILRQVKLILGSSEMKKLKTELDAVTSSLDQFYRALLLNRTEVHTTITPRKTTQLAASLRQIRCYAAGLFAALCRCCHGKNCHINHEASLFLDERVDLLRSASKMGRDKVQSLVFRLIFDTTLPEPTSPFWHEVPIRLLEDCGQDSTSCAIGTQARVKLVVPEDATTHLPTPVDDFCTIVTTAHGRRQPVAFVILRSGQMGTISTEEQTVLMEAKRNRVTLKEILSDSSSIPYGLSLDLRLRMLLALQLASNLLQLSHTRWLYPAWSKETIYFLVQPKKEGVRQMVDFSRAFVTSTVHTHQADVPACDLSVGPRVMLLELGILLLEIWHQKPFEMRFSENEAPRDHYLRLARALEWLETDSNRPLILYESAISCCIKGPSSGGAWPLTWEADDLWAGICRCIIEPLSKNCEQWREGYTYTT